MARPSTKKRAQRRAGILKKPEKNLSTGKKSLKEALAFADKFPEPDFGKVAKVKIAQISTVATGQGVTTFALGKDNKLYVWNAYLSGWVLNAMGDEEKANLKVSIAVQKKMREEDAARNAQGHQPAIAGNQRANETHEGEQLELPEMSELTEEREDVFA